MDVAAADTSLERRDWPTQVRWLVFFLCCATSFVLYLHRYTFGIVKKDLEVEFGWTTQELGLLDTAFSSSYAVGQIPGGMLGDWFGVRAVLTVMILGWAVSLAGTTFCRDFRDMWACRFVFGLSQAGCYPNLGKVTKAWFPISIRTVVQGLVSSFSGRLGGAASNILLGTVLMGALGLGWRTAIVCFSVLGIALAAAFLFLFRNSPAQHPWSNEAEARDVVAGDATAAVTSRAKLNWSEAFRNRSVRALVFQQFTSAYADNVFVFWIPLFLRGVKGVDIKAAGWMSAMPLVGGAIGGMIGSVLQNLLIQKTGNRRWCRSLIGFTGSSMATVFMLTSLQFDDAIAIVAVFFALKFFADWTQPTVWATITDIGGRSSASVFAIINTSGSIGGIISGPVMGWMIWHFSGGAATPTAAGWNALFFSLAVIYSVSAMAWLFVDCTRPIEKDVPAVQEMKEVL